MQVDIMMGTLAKEDATGEMEYIAALRDCLQSAYEDVRKHLNIAAERQNRYNSGVSGSPYAVGDLVWSVNKNCRKGISPKLRVQCRSSIGWVGWILAGRHCKNCSGSPKSQQYTFEPKMDHNGNRLCQVKY